MFFSKTAPYNVHINTSNHMDHNLVLQLLVHSELTTVASHNASVARVALTEACCPRTVGVGPTVALVPSGCCRARCPNLCVRYFVCHHQANKTLLPFEKGYKRSGSQNSSLCVWLCQKKCMHTYCAPNVKKKKESQQYYTVLRTIMFVDAQATSASKQILLY